MRPKKLLWIVMLPFSLLAQVDCDSVPVNYLGVCKSYNSKGFVNHEANYLNGKLNGKEFYYKNGNLSSEYDYSNGVINSCKYYKDSNILESLFIYENGVKVVEISYWENGFKHSEVGLIGSIKNGWDIEYYSNGQLKDKYYYIDGFATKEGEGYYANGNLQYKTTYADSTKTENYCQYYENGNLEYCWIKVNDILKDDPFKVFYSSGHLKSNHYLFNNNTYVLIITYDECGRIIGREVNNHVAILKKRRCKFRMNKPFRIEQKYRQCYKR